MIAFLQNNIAAFAGNHVVYWPGQPVLQQRVSVTSAAGAATNRLLLINPPSLDGGFGGGMLQ